MKPTVLLLVGIALILHAHSDAALLRAGTAGDTVHESSSELIVGSAPRSAEQSSSEEAGESSVAPEVVIAPTCKNPIGYGLVNRPLENNCFIDSYIFSMFAYSHTFDYLLRPSGEDEFEEQDVVRGHLRELINNLRAGDQYANVRQIRDDMGKVIIRKGKNGAKDKYETFGDRSAHDANEAWSQLLKKLHIPSDDANLMQLDMFRDFCFEATEDRCVKWGADPRGESKTLNTDHLLLAFDMAPSVTVATIGQALQLYLTDAPAQQGLSAKDIKKFQDSKTFGDVDLGGFVPIQKKEKREAEWNPLTGKVEVFRKKDRQLLETVEASDVAAAKSLLSKDEFDARHEAEKDKPLDYLNKKAPTLHNLAQAVAREDLRKEGYDLVMIQYASRDHSAATKDVADFNIVEEIETEAKTILEGGDEIESGGKPLSEYHGAVSEALVELVDKLKMELPGKSEDVLPAVTQAASVVYRNVQVIADKLRARCKLIMNNALKKSDYNEAAATKLVRDIARSKTKDFSGEDLDNDATGANMFDARVSVPAPKAPKAPKSSLVFSRKRASIVKTGPHLTLYCQRVPGFQRTDMLVDPVLDLTKDTVQGVGNTNKWMLNGISVRHGGHYVSFARYPDGTWYYLNDLGCNGKTDCIKPWYQGDGYSPGVKASKTASKSKLLGAVGMFEEVLFGDLQSKSLKKVREITGFRQWISKYGFNFTYVPLEE